MPRSSTAEVLRRGRPAHPDRLAPRAVGLPVPRVHPVPECGVGHLLLPGHRRPAVLGDRQGREERREEGLGGGAGDPLAAPRRTGRGLHGEHVAAPPLSQVQSRPADDGAAGVRRADAHQVRSGRVPEQDHLLGRRPGAARRTGARPGSCRSPDHAMVTVPSSARSIWRLVTVVRAPEQGLDRPAGSRQVRRHAHPPRAAARLPLLVPGDHRAPGRVDDGVGRSQLDEGLLVEPRGPLPAAAAGAVPGQQPRVAERATLLPGEQGAADRRGQAGVDAELALRRQPLRLRPPSGGGPRGRAHAHRAAVRLRPRDGRRAAAVDGDLRPAAVRRRAGVAPAEPAGQRPRLRPAAVRAAGRDADLVAARAGLHPGRDRVAARPDVQVGQRDVPAGHAGQGHRRAPLRGGGRRDGQQGEQRRERGEDRDASSERGHAPLCPTQGPAKRSRLGGGQYCRPP